MVNTNQKRKRGSIDSALEHENEEDDEGNLKSRKISVAVESAAEEQPADSTGVQASLVSVDELGSYESLQANDGQNELSASQSDISHEVSVSVTTNAHKQILQQQWTLEAHKQVQKSMVERLDESVGSEMFSENNFPDGQASEKNGKPVAVVSITPHSTRSSKKTSTPAPAPRVFQQTEKVVSDLVVAKGLVVDTQHSTPDRENSGIVTENSVDNAAEKAASGSSTFPIAVFPDVLESERNKDVADVPVVEVASKHSKKEAFTRMLKIFIVAVSIVIFAALLCIPSSPKDTLLVNTTVKSAIEKPRETFISESEMEIITQSSNQLQQLTALENETLFLTAIVDRNAEKEKEAAVVKAEADKELLAYQTQVEEGLIDLEKSVLDLEKQTESVAKGISSLQYESMVELMVTQADAAIEINRVLPLGDLIEGERRVGVAEREATEVSRGISESEDAEETEEETEVEGETHVEGDASSVARVETTKQDEEAIAGVARAESTLSSLEQEVINNEESLIEAAKEAERQAEQTKRVERETDMELEKDVRDQMSVLAEAEAAAALLQAAAQAAEAAAVVDSDDDILGDEGDVEVITETTTMNEGYKAAIPPPSKFLFNLGLDYAVWPRGGRVVLPGETAVLNGKAIVLTSLPYILSQGPLKRMRYQLRLDREGADETVLVSPYLGGSLKDQYSCYSFAGSTGSATVMMHSTVKVSAVQIVYRPRPEGNSGTASAPKNIQLIGWTGVPSSSQSSHSEGIDLGTFTYDITDDEESEGLQTFTLSDSADYPPLKAVTVSILSNYGESSYTSICRVKVIGQLQN